MSTVDLTKVAGFKAVDAEGNDMGVVSLSEMTNMVKESIIQEAVAMQSVSTLAEASTLAATDTYEDKLDISDTFSYVRTLDSSGNPKRTSQNALATVVGGLQIDNSRYYENLDDIPDKFMLVYFTKSPSLWDSASSGLCINIPSRANIRLQFAYRNDAVAFRVMWGNVWGDWVNISIAKLVTLLS